MTRHRKDRGDLILGFIEEYKVGHGYAPSVREIADAVGLAGPSGVKYHLDALRSAGRLRAASYRARSWTVPQQPKLTADRIELAYCLSAHGSKPPKVRPCKRHRMMAEWFTEIVIPRALALP